MTITEMRVHMDCAGCESRIKKALKKLNGVDDIDIDLGMQKVTVMGWADQEKVLKAVRKTGRRAEFWPYPYNPEYHVLTQPYYYQKHHDYRNLQPVATFYKPQPSSSYNYYEHGYDGDEHGYYKQPSVFVEKTSALFSDENPHACSIM